MCETPRRTAPAPVPVRWPCRPGAGRNCRHARRSGSDGARPAWTACAGSRAAHGRVCLAASAPGSDRPDAEPAGPEREPLAGALRAREGGSEAAVGLLGVAGRVVEMAHVGKPDLLHGSPFVSPAGVLTSRSSLRVGLRAGSIGLSGLSMQPKTLLVRAPMHMKVHGCPRRRAKSPRGGKRQALTRRDHSACGSLRTIGTHCGQAMLMRAGSPFADPEQIPVGGT